MSEGRCGLVRFNVQADFVDAGAIADMLVANSTLELAQDFGARSRGLEFSSPAQRTLESAQGAMVDDGVCLIDFSEVPRRSEGERTLETIWLQRLGEPFRVFAHEPLWKPIGVRFDVAPERAEGVGHNPLHIDFVNAEVPPQVVGLYCIRPDPRGGGATLLSNLRAAVTSLSDAAAEALARPTFVDGRVENLMNVGRDANPFRVLDVEIIRFTAKMISNMPRGSVERAALEELSRALLREQQVVRLRSWELLLVNQAVMVHGRTALGPHQEEVPAGERRLIEQIFIRL